MASFGLTLANRGVIIGIVKAGDLIELAQEAEAAGVFDAQSPAQAQERLVMGIRSAERVGRLEEGIVILRRLFHEKKAGMQHIALRLTSWDQRGQLKRFLSEIAPAFGGG